jgi:phospholipase D1/2
VGRAGSKRAPLGQGQPRHRGDANAGGAAAAGEHAAHHHHQHQQQQQSPGDFPMLDKAQAEHALKHVQGHLVSWPYEWLSSEMAHGRWNHAVDNLAPLEI